MHVAFHIIVVECHRIQRIDIDCIVEFDLTFLDVKPAAPVLIQFPFAAGSKETGFADHGTYPESSQRQLSG